ncbi:hypothetical protein GPECTOR_14g42 [Gonium pectorale]|uniref:Major facilitator superfamily (MFS) profile domain-containing protein n=1 Tax=Gonium pectorale TaxID=33097 RepID=A0A150GMG8_GONPE|nr:hypothetical protein GPECTOR_14g42 [Gonium pectorale]|eukprot:KXZ51056.1 hypothetical protein GPECTOR_14g42 [Gonium pectorale]
MTFLLAAFLLLQLVRQQQQLTAGPASRLPRTIAPGGLEASDESGPPELHPLLAAPHEDPQTCAAEPHVGLEKSTGGDADSDSYGCGCLGALAYMAQRPNWDVAALVWIKATGAMCWGAADVLNGRFSQMPRMQVVTPQTLGGADQTLGFILVAVGLGSIVGPLVANSVTPGVARYWRISIAAAFGMLLAGYGIMAAAQNITHVLIATVIRTSVDFLLYTISEAGSQLFGGAAEDGMGWGTRRLSATLALLAGTFMIMWSLHAVVMWSSRRGPLMTAMGP